MAVMFAVRTEFAAIANWAQGLVDDPLHPAADPVLVQFVNV